MTRVYTIKFTSIDVLFNSILIITSNLLNVYPAIDFELQQTFIIVARVNTIKFTSIDVLFNSILIITSNLMNVYPR